MDPIFSYPQLPTQQCHLLAYTMYMHFPQPTRHPPDVRRPVHHPHNSLRQSRSLGEGLMPTWMHFRSYQAQTAHFPVSPLRFFTPPDIRCLRNPLRRLTRHPTGIINGRLRPGGLGGAAASTGSQRMMTTTYANLPPTPETILGAQGSLTRPQMPKNKRISPAAGPTPLPMRLRLTTRRMIQYTCRQTSPPHPP